MKLIPSFLDRSLPSQGRVMRARTSWMAMGSARTVDATGLVQPINLLHPGEGSA